MLEFDLLRVFVDREGGGGCPLAVFLSGESIDARDRPSLAASLGVEATVFVDDRERAAVRTFTAAGRQVPLAGQALVGTAWLLDVSGVPAGTLRTPAGRVPTWREEDVTWVRAAPDPLPPFDTVQVGSPSDVESFSNDGGPPVQAWAWEDSAEGIVRFQVPSRGVPGGPGDPLRVAALCLAPELRRPLTMRSAGGGPVLRARPATGGSVELGGRVAFVAATDYDSFTAAGA